MAVAQELQASGHDVVLACLYDDGDIGRYQDGRPAIRVVDLTAPRDWGAAEEWCAAAVSRYGGEGAAVEEWRHLPGMGLWQALSGLGELAGSAEHVVVDLGDLRLAGEFLSSAVRLPWTVRRLLGLQPALAEAFGAEAAALADRVLDGTEQASEVVRAAGTHLHLSIPQDEWGRRKLRRGVPGLLLSGVRAGLAVQRSGTTPPAEQTWDPFTPVVVDSPSEPAATEETDTGQRPLSAALQSLTGVEEPDTLVVDRDRGVVSWRIPLPWVHGEDVHVYEREEELVVTLHGRPYLLRSPAVVRRCRPVRARLVGADLVIESHPKEGLWRG